MIFSTECRIQSDSQNLHDLSEFYYLEFYLDCDSLIMSNSLIDKVHKLVLLRHKSHAMASSSSIILDMSIDKLPAVILNEFLSGYQCNAIHKS